MAEGESLLLRDLSEACRRGAKADIHRLWPCLEEARQKIRAHAPSLKEFKDWLESPARGMPPAGTALRRQKLFWRHAMS